MNTCPICAKDMTIRPGAVFTCRLAMCPYWRITFVDAGLSQEEFQKDKDDERNSDWTH